MFLVITLNAANVIAKDALTDGFYVGVDASQNDETRGKLDNSISGEGAVEGKYYGYKFSEGGFFVSSEIMMEDTMLMGSENKGSDQSDISDIVNYGVTANVGYDFNRNVSGFLVYDVANFSYDSSQGIDGVDANNLLNGGTIGIGSQINLSDNFGVKVLYSTHKFEGAGGGKMRSDVVKVGTVFSF